MAKITSQHTKIELANIKEAIKWLRENVQNKDNNWFEHEEYGWWLNVGDYGRYWVFIRDDRKRFLFRIMGF